MAAKNRTRRRTFSRGHFLLGLALVQSGDFAGAQKAFQTVADVVPLSEVYNDLGAAQNRRDLPQAVDSFREAVKAIPTIRCTSSIWATRCGREERHSPLPPTAFARCSTGNRMTTWQH